MVSGGDHSHHGNLYLQDENALEAFISRHKLSIMNDEKELKEIVNDLARRVALLEKQHDKKENPLGFCHSTLRKGELAQFFYILMAEGIFFFDRSNTKTTG